MMKWARFLIVGVLVAASLLSVFAQEEIEVGDTIEGEGSDEITEYEIELEEGQTIEITIDADWDTYLELYDDRGNLVASDDDSAGNLLSRIVYVVEDSDDYVIRVRSFGGDTPEDDFELTVEEIEVSDEVDAGLLEYDDGEDVDADDAFAVIASFEGTAGDVINIVTRSDDYLNTTVTLIDPDGDEELESSNFYGDGSIQRHELEASGTYTIRIVESGGAPLSGDIEIEVEIATLLNLDAGEVSFEIGSSVNQVFVDFTGVEDVVYILTVEVDELPEYTEIAGYILEEGQNLTDYTNYSFRMSGGSGIAYRFEAPDDGLFTIRVEHFGGEEIDVTMSIDVAE